MLYSDLGLVEATGGQFHAHILKWNPELRKKDNVVGVKPTIVMHRNHYDFHFNYVLKGWTSFEIDGVEGTFTFRAGDSFFLPHWILHNETGAFDDVEILSFQAPANVATKQLEEGVGHGKSVNDMTKKENENQYLKGWNKQTPVCTTQTAEGRHPSQKVREFLPGMRGNVLYADLGLAEATGGQFHAHILKWNPELRKKDNVVGVKATIVMHRNHYDFHFNYVLKGWTSFEIEGVEGRLTFRAGDSFFLPHGILHNETGASDDVEILKVFGPGNVATE